MITQYETQRSVIDLRDIEDGSYKDANELLENTSEDQNAQIRSGLQIAQRSGIYKYVCAVCGQPLKLCSRRFDRRESWFFAHFPNSEDCPVKTESAYNPLRWAELWYNMFKESKLHKSITETLYRILSNSYEFSDVAKNKRIYFPEISNEWRIPDVIAQYNHKNLVFEFQLYTTFLNTIIDRNSFYRLIGYEILWIFPYFTPSDQRLCEKDTYYSHRRNVFVFDTESYYCSKPNDDKPKLPFEKTNYKFAQEESLRRGTLMLNCYWQEPYILNEKLFFKWHHKLISIKELKYDEKTHDVFYIDSDQLFYDKADPKSKQLFDEWKEVKEKRWDKIFRDIKERTRLSMLSEEDRVARDNQREENRRKIDIINKARNGEIELQLFSNNRSENEEDDNGNPLPDLWGYRYNDLVIIEPKYEDAKPFIGRVAPVKTKKKGHWGAINVEGKKVIQFQYDTFIPVASNCFAVSKDHKYGCINQNGEEIVPFKYGKMTPIGSSCLLVDTGWWNFKKFWNGTWYDGSWEYHAGCSMAIDLKGNELFNVSGTDVRVINDFIICGGSYFSFLLFGPAGKKLHDYVFNSCEIINKNIVVSRMIEKERKYGILTDNGKDFILPIEYDNIVKFNDIYLKVQKKGCFGLINKNLTLDLDCIYDDIVLLSEDYLKVQIRGKWSLYNINTHKLFDDIYYNITFDESRNTLYAYQDLNHYGELSPTGIPVTFKEKKVVSGLYLFKRLGYQGVMNEEGVEILPCEFDEIDYLEEINGFKVSKGDGYSLIDKKGMYKSNILFSHIDDFQDGIAKVSVNFSSQKATGYIDTEGNIIPDRKEILNDEVVVNYCFGFVEILDVKSKLLFSYKDEIEAIESFSPGVYKIMQRLHYGLLSIYAGKIIVACEFDSIESWSKNVAVGYQNSRTYPNPYNRLGIYKLIPLDGTPVNSKDYYQIDKLQNGRAHAVRLGLNGWLDDNGNEICEAKEQLTATLTKVKYFELWGINDSDNRVIIPCKYREITIFDNNKILAKNTSDTYCLFGEDGHLLLDYNFRDIKAFDHGSFVVKTNYCALLNSECVPIIPFDRFCLSINKWSDHLYVAEIQDCNYIYSKFKYFSLFDNHGEIVTKQKYYQIGELIDGQAKVSVYNKTGYINEKGEEISRVVEVKGEWIIKEFFGNFSVYKNDELILSNYAEATFINDVLIKVLRDRLFQLYNIADKKLLDEKYRWIGCFEADRAKAKDKSHNKGYVDKNGCQIMDIDKRDNCSIRRGFNQILVYVNNIQILKSLNLEEAGFYTNNIIKFKQKNEKYYKLYSICERCILDRQFKKIGDLINGKAEAIDIYSQRGFLDSSGNVIYDSIIGITDTIKAFWGFSKCELKEEEETLLKDMLDVSKWSNDCIKVKKSNQKCQLYNIKSKCFVGETYQDIYNLEDGKAKAILNGIAGYIDINGNMIPDSKIQLGENLYKIKAFGLWWIVNNSCQNNLKEPYIEIGSYKGNLIGFIGQTYHIINIKISKMVPVLGCYYSSNISSYIYKVGARYITIRRKSLIYDNNPSTGYDFVKENQMMSIVITSIKGNKIYGIPFVKSKKRNEYPSFENNQKVYGVIFEIKPFGIRIKTSDGVKTLIHKTRLEEIGYSGFLFVKGQRITIRKVGYDEEHKNDLWNIESVSQL